MAEDRNVYEDQFGQRINEIAQPGAPPPSPEPGGPSGGIDWGWKGTGGVVVAVIIAIRLVLFCLRSSGSDSRTPPLPPPQQPSFPRQAEEFIPRPLPDDFMDPKKWEEGQRKGKEQEKPFEPLDPLAEWVKKNRKPGLPPSEGGQKQDGKKENAPPADGKE